MTITVIGVDIGGTGARAAIARDGTVLATVDGPRDSLRELAEQLLTSTQTAGVDAVAVGATGFAMLGAQMRATYPGLLREVCGAKVVALSSDTITSFAGALSLQPGAVIAAGTGAVALGSDLQGKWLRVDGWGYLVGDEGGGSWIGRRALHAALRAEDGRPGASLALNTFMHKRFGAPADMIADLTARSDRAGAMATFVPDVVTAAELGDPVAVSILDEAGMHLADTALAALPSGERAIATTGNLFRAGGVLWESFVRRIGDRADLRPADGSSVDGAVLLATSAYRGKMPEGAPVELH